MQLIPEKVFQRMAAQNRAGIAPNSKVAKARRFIFANASPLMPDKQGRVIIPDRYMADSDVRDAIIGDAALDREVTLVGANDRVELWSRSRLTDHMKTLLGDLDMQNMVDELFSDAVHRFRPAANAAAGHEQLRRTPHGAVRQSHDATRKKTGSQDAIITKSHDATQNNYASGRVASR